MRIPTPFHRRRRSWRSPVPHAFSLAWRTLFAVVACAIAFAAGAADPAKVLRIAQFDIDTLDPQQYADDPSFQVIMALFEPLYEWDYLSPTPKLTPLTAAGPPEVTDGGRVWTIRFKKGILFTDDPAFKGKPRELVAEDYVYSYKRWLDPNGRRARPAGAHRPHPRRAPGHRSGQEDGQVRLRRADRGPARARPLHAADPDVGAQLSERARPAELRRRRRARGGRGRRARSAHPCRRHRAFPPQGMEARLPA